MRYMFVHLSVIKMSICGSWKYKYIHICIRSINVLYHTYYMIDYWSYMQFER